MKYKFAKLTLAVIVSSYSLFFPSHSIANNNVNNNENFFLRGDDPNNPLRPFKQPITNEIVNVANSILADKGNLSPHQKVVAFMDFIADFEVGIASNSSPEATVNERIGACGTFTNLLLALAATQGINGRIISLGNYPTDDGHAVAELWINGKWSVYDPTYASYYTDTLYNSTNPNVLSFEELRKGEGKRKDVALILNGKQRFNQSPLLAKDYVGTDIYEKANPAGPIGPENPFIYPLWLDVNQKVEIRNNDFGPKNQGAQYIGAAGINNYHNWRLTSLIPGKEYELEIVPDWIGGDFLNNETDFQLTAEMKAGGRLLGQANKTFFSKELNPWTIRFKADDSVVNILIKHPYFGPELKYIFLKEIRIKNIS